MAQLIVALDYTNAEDALATAESLRGCPIWMKVGLELFTHEGPAVVKKLKDMGFKVMLDLKMFDIPNTVAGGVRSACLMGVDLITLHALGGERMIHAAVDAVRQNAEEGGPKPLLFAVTVLTSMAPGELPGYGGRTFPGLAADLAAGGQAWGLDGVACLRPRSRSHQIPLPRPAMYLTPGIRPASGSASDDQRRIMTPAQAVRIGSDFLVVGRPITKAPVPADAARAILDQMEKGVGRANHSSAGRGEPFSRRGLPSPPNTPPSPLPRLARGSPACLHMRERADRNPSLELFGFFNSDAQPPHQSNVFEEEGGGLQGEGETFLESFSLPLRVQHPTHWYSP